jgi:hypothetical protein
MTTSHRTGPRFSRSRWFLGFLVFLAVSIYMLLTEHRALPGRAATGPPGDLRHRSCADASPCRTRRR